MQSLVLYFSFCLVDKIFVMFCQGLHYTVPFLGENRAKGTLQICCSFFRTKSSTWLSSEGVYRRHLLIFYVYVFFVTQDLPGALDDAAITESLELHKIKNRQWAIFKTSAIKGEGIFEGLDW
jgi:ADP-ribosylation factor family